jgi:hypothetical protein
LIPVKHLVGTTLHPVIPAEAGIHFQWHMVLPARPLQRSSFFRSRCVADQKNAEETGGQYVASLEMDSGIRRNDGGGEHVRVY